jgi:membrane protease YdiL (CAAX protease family)
MRTVQKQILTFLALTFILSWVVMGLIIAKGGLQQAGILIFLVMWIPGLVSLGYRAIARIGFHDVGWKLGAGKYWLFAFFVPLIVAAIAFSISWWSGVSEFTLPAKEMLERNGASNSFQLILKAYPISFVVGCIAALGEELGWRGFLVPKFYSSGWKSPLLLSSSIWGAWHIPLILWGGYASSDLPLISVILFMFIIILSGVFVGWLRMASGSVWVAMTYHAAHNLFLQTAFEVFNKPAPLSPYLAGESGLFPCVVYLAVLFVGYKWMYRKDYACDT